MPLPGQNPSPGGQVTGIDIHASNTFDVDNGDNSKDTDNLYDSPDNTEDPDDGGESDNNGHQGIGAKCSSDSTHHDLHDPTLGVLHIRETGHSSYLHSSWF